jgi:hypothetical protein
VVREVTSRQVVTCPECGYQCTHAKIIGHLKRCQKALQANNRAQQQQQQKQPAMKSTPVDEVTARTSPAATIPSPSPPPLKVNHRQYFTFFSISKKTGQNRN